MSQEEKRPLLRVGETVGEYMVKAVGNDGMVYKCSKLSNDEEVFVRCAGPEIWSNRVWPRLPTFQWGDASHMHYVSSQQCNGLFEMLSGPHKFAYPIQGRDGDGSIEYGDVANSRELEMLQTMLKPSGAFGLTCRREDCHFEVDFPAVCHGGTRIMLTTSFLILLVALEVWFLDALNDDFAITLPNLISALFVAALVSAIFVPFAIYALRSLYAHENLAITPETFSIAKTLERESQYRDSVNNAHNAAGKHPFLDRLLYRQVGGATKNLKRAELKECWMTGLVKRKKVVLLDGRRKHELWFPLSDVAAQALVDEINRTIQNIEQMAKLR